MNAAQSITAALLLTVSAVPSAGQASKNRLDSPGKIAAYVNDNTQDADLSLIWKRLRLAVTGQAPDRCGCRSDECPGTCRATVFDVGRDAQQSRRSVTSDLLRRRGRLQIYCFQERATVARRRAD